MRISKTRLAVLREHIKAESTHNIEELLEGMTANCFNDVCCVPKPFVGPKKVAERYRKHWAGFPDFKVRVKRFLAADDKCIVTETSGAGPIGVRSSAFGLPGNVCACVLWSCGTFEGTSFGAKRSFLIWARSRCRSALRSR